ncbi:hypothetical protein ACFLVK_02170 [Chloroflexota bacterium]
MGVLTGCAEPAPAPVPIPAPQPQPAPTLAPAPVETPEQTENSSEDSIADYYYLSPEQVYEYAKQAYEKFYPAMQVGDEETMREAEWLLKRCMYAVAYSDDQSRYKKWAALSRALLEHRDDRILSEKQFAEFVELYRELVDELSKSITNKEVMGILKNNNFEEYLYGSRGCG